MDRRASAATCVAAILIAAPALAFDCTKASKAMEKAICGSPDALAADSEMTKAYGALQAASDGKQRAALLKSQVNWLKSRDDTCGDKKGAELSACLSQESRERARFLQGAPKAGPGLATNPLPALRIEPGGKGRTDVDIEAFKFANPASAAERAFNAAVDKAQGEIVEPDKDDAQADNYAYSVKMRLAYASPRLISAHAEIYSDAGAAHPNLSSADINIDVAAGREATFDLLLDKAAAQKIFALCASQVAADKKDREGEDAGLDADGLKQLRGNVAAATGDLKIWSFGADSATVTYDADTIGAHAEGAFSCAIPYATLRPLAKPGFPLP